MTSVRGRGHPARRGQASKAPIDRFNNGDHEDPLGSDELGPSKAPEIPIGPPKTPLPTPSALDVARYTQKDMDHLLQTFIQASKGGSGDKLKAKTSDVYRARSPMEYYNFCQLCKDYFTTFGATGLNRIPFAAFFL